MPARNTMVACSGMTFDSTGKYFYYFDNFTRYIISVVGRKLYNSSFIGFDNNKVAASNKVNYEDITVSLGTANTNVYVWDDYSLLHTYGNSYKQTGLTFSDKS